jgi:hypothetical protein
MGMNRRLVPYVLLAILALGSGLGMGLGLTRGPNTYSQPSPMAALRSCMSEAMDGGTPPVRVARGYQRWLARTEANFKICVEEDGYDSQQFKGFVRQ